MLTGSSTVARVDKAQTSDKQIADLFTLGQLPDPNQNNTWYRFNDSDTAVVFIHGVLSNSRTCWLNESDASGERCYWPELLAADDRFGKPAIYLGGYYSAVDSGPYEIRNCAHELFSAISVSDEHNRPPLLAKQRILFICHSTGGIVARYSLTRYEKEFASKDIGLVLIASPSYGSHLADRLQLISQFYSHAVDAQLQWGSWSLRELDARFKDLVHERRIPQLRGVEACENHFIVHRKFLPNRRLVVTEESAGRYFGAPVMLRNTDHFSCVKPDGRRHPAHELLWAFWSRDFKPRSDAERGAEQMDEDSASQTAAALAQLAVLGWTVKPGGKEMLFEVTNQPLPPMDKSAEQFKRVKRPFKLHFQRVPNLDGLHYLAPLKNCTKIEINASELTDISELNGFVNLTNLVISQVPLTGDGTVDASPLASLTNLESLSLGHTRVRFAAFLSSLKRLKTLRLGHTPIADISSLSGMSNLVSLEIRETRVTDLAPLSNDENLEELTISNEQVPGLKSLVGLKKLKKVKLIDQRPVDMTPMALLSNLEDVSIWGPTFFDLAPLGRLTKLQKLSVGGFGFARGLSGIRNVEALGNLRELKTLVLNSLNVDDIGFTHDLKTLTELSLIQLPIVSLDSVRELLALKKISLVDVRVVDILPLLDLPNLAELYLIRVPARADVIAELKRRGVKLSP